MKDTFHRFEGLTREEILALPVGAYDDYNLLDVIEYLNEQDDDRSFAVTELILRSPDHSEMVDYLELYHDLFEYYLLDERDYPAALGWCYARLAYQAQHEPPADWPDALRDLADVYLESGDLQTGLAIYTRLLRADPGDIWSYNALGMVLPTSGLESLAIESLRRGLTLSGHPDFDEIKDQLETMLQDLLQEVEKGDVDAAMGSLNPEVVDDFKAALALTVDGQRAEDQPLPYLPPIAGLLTAGPERDEALYGEVLAQGRLLAADLIFLAFDENQRSTPAPAHAIALLRELRQTMPAELTHLSDWLERADGDWQTELLGSLFGKIGGYSTTELESYVADTSHNEHLRIAALETLSNRAEDQPALRDRVVDFLRILLTRPEAYQASEETMVGFAISSALDLEGRELYPEIKAVFDEDRVDPMVVDLAGVHHEWGLPAIYEPVGPKESMLLYLKCTSCGRARRHSVRYVLVDRGTIKREEEGQPVKHDPCIMDHEIVCPKCGAKDKYELTSQAQMSILGPQDLAGIQAMLSGEEPATPPKFNPRVYYFEASALGRPMHPLDALEEYHWQIANRPGDARLHMGLGNILRLLFRYDQALEELRFAYELAPQDADIILTLALAEHDFGDLEAARQLYEKVLNLVVQGARASMNPIELSQAALEGLEALKRGRPSYWEVPVYNADGDLLPRLGRFAAIAGDSPARGKGKSSRKRKK